MELELKEREFLPKLCACVPRRTDAFSKAKGALTFDLMFIRCLLLIDENKHNRVLDKINASINTFFKSFLSLQHFSHTCLKHLHIKVCIYRILPWIERCMCVP